MELIMFLCGMFFGLIIGSHMTNLEWIANSEEPRRLSKKGKFFKSVRLDSEYSWRMLNIHNDD